MELPRAEHRTTAGDLGAIDCCLDNNGSTTPTTTAKKTTTTTTTFNQQMSAVSECSRSHISIYRYVDMPIYKYISNTIIVCRVTVETIVICGDAIVQ